MTPEAHVKRQTPGVNCCGELPMYLSHIAGSRFPMPHAPLAWVREKRITTPAHLGSEMSAAPRPPRERAIAAEEHLPLLVETQPYNRCPTPKKISRPV